MKRSRFSLAFIGKFLFRQGGSGSSKDLMSSSEVLQETTARLVRGARGALWVGYFIRSLSAAFTAGLA